MTTPLVLLHGFTHTGSSWNLVRTALGERYRALAPDLRGHGAAGRSRPVSLEAVVGDLSALAPERFALCGYSMGGRIALHAALALPDRVTAVAAIGASPGIADPAARAARRAADEALAAEFERMSIEQVVETWEARATVLAGQPAAVRRTVRMDRLRNTPGGLAAALRGLGTGALAPLWNRLGELSMPVELVVGERDLKFREIAAAMAGAIGDVRIEEVAGAGHAVHLEAPEAVARILGEISGR